MGFSVESGSVVALVEFEWIFFFKISRSWTAVDAHRGSHGALDKVASEELAESVVVGANRSRYTMASVG